MSAASQNVFSDRIVAIGASTGGEEALLEVLSHFPRDCLFIPDSKVSTRLEFVRGVSA